MAGTAVTLTRQEIQTADAAGLVTAIGAIENAIDGLQGLSQQEKAKGAVEIHGKLQCVSERYRTLNVLGPEPFVGRLIVSAAKRLMTEGFELDPRDD